MKAIDLSSNLAEYFRTQLTETAHAQGRVLDEHTGQYLSKLLCRFTDTSNYLMRNPSEPKKLCFPTLAMMWLEGLSKGTFEQYLSMQQLGDFALFTSGFFADRIQGSHLDMDYYFAMGGNAYKRAGEIKQSISAERALNVFFELASDFQAHSELLNELSLRSNLFDENDVLKLYEKWQESKCGRIARILNEKGIIPTDLVEDE